MKTFIFFAVLIATGCCLEGMDNFEVESYLGLWYEIAHIPQWYELGRVCSQFNYSLNADGSVRSVNAYKSKTTDEKFSIMEQEVTKKDKPYKLLLKLPDLDFSEEFWVLKTDYKTYSVAVIPDVTSLWFFARTPTINETLYTSLVDFAKSKNLPVEKLENSTQTCGAFL